MYDVQHGSIFHRSPAPGCAGRSAPPMPDERKRCCGKITGLLIAALLGATTAAAAVTVHHLARSPDRDGAALSAPVNGRLPGLAGFEDVLY